MRSIELPLRRECAGVTSECIFKFQNSKCQVINSLYLIMCACILFLIFGGKQTRAVGGWVGGGDGGS